MEFCKSEHIHLLAHQPLGGKPVGVVNPNASRPGPLLDSHVRHKIPRAPSSCSAKIFLQIIEIAAECGRSPAQVILSWAVQRGTAVIPKTVHEDRLAENMNLFKLRNEHFNRIDCLSKTTGTVRYLDPTGHIGFDVFDEHHDQPIHNSAPWN